MRLPKTSLKMPASKRAIKQVTRQVKPRRYTAMLRKTQLARQLARLRKSCRTESSKNV